MSWFNCIGIPDYVCILKGVFLALMVGLIGMLLDEIVNRKKYKNERDLKKMENKKIKEILEREDE